MIMFINRKEKACPGGAPFQCTKEGQTALGACSLEETGVVKKGAS